MTMTTSGQIMPWYDCLKTKGNVKIKLWDFDCLHFAQYILISPHGIDCKQTWCKKIYHMDRVSWLKPLLSICSTGRPETSIDCLFYWSIFPIIYYVYLHTLKLFKSAWNLRLLRWRMKRTWPATFVEMWTARFRSFAQAQYCHNTREFKRFPVEQTWSKPFSSAFAE